MLTKEQGAALDEQVLGFIRGGATTLREIAKRCGIDSAPPEIISHEMLRRRVDRSLQRLRAKKQIHYLGAARGGGWRIGASQ